MLGTHTYIQPTDNSDPVEYAIRTDITDTDGQDVPEGAVERGKCVGAAVVKVAPQGKFKIVEEKLSFDTSGVTEDATGNPYSTSQWIGVGNDERTNKLTGFPISYPISLPDKDSYLGINAEVTIAADGAQPLPVGTYYIDGQDSSALGIDWQGEATVAATPDGEILTASLMPDSKLPDGISIKDLNIIWSITCKDVQDNVIDTETVSTSNRLYLTGVAAPNAFETVLSLGCDAADGLSTNGVKANEQITDAIWRTFELGNDGPDLKSVNGYGLTYTMMGVTTTAELLRTGIGQCNAFSNLLKDTLGAQGVPAILRRMESKDRARYPQFVVKSMATQGSGGSALPAIDSGFDFHVVVEVLDYPYRVYDPSLGKVTIAERRPGAAENQYERDTVVAMRAANGRYVATNIDPKNPNYNLVWTNER